MDFAEITKTLEKNGFKVSCFETKEAAAEYLNGRIDGKSVAFGGSVTVKEMGLYESLGKHNKVVWHWEVPEGKTGSEVLLEAMTTDVYIASANAIAKTGEIINIDGRGNRISSLVFGHEKVFYVVGRNKIAEDFHSAVERARNIACPLNSKRLSRRTPCAAEGRRCYDCSSPERICRTMTVTWRPSMGLEAEIVLIDEDLGF